MKLSKKISVFICVHLWLILLLFTANAQTKLTSKVLLIPLDDRPPCLQMPVKMGLIGDVEVVTPPRELLGRFTEFGKSDEIINWLKTQNLKSFDAAIVSVDMLAYGGLVAMREYETSLENAKKRIEFLRQMRKIAPKMPIYGSSVIMRLAPTGNLVNESYRANLARWADVSPYPSKKAETEELEKKIPAEALEKYKKARQRDLAINLFTVDLVKEKIIDYLILSQDDAKPEGIHIADREKLIEYVKTNNLGEKVAVQPGADEVSMLLLARTMTDKYKYHPKIKAIYSDEKIADQAMPYEDRPLRNTVSFHIKAVGAKEVEKEKDADILFYIFVSRFEKGRAKSFARQISDSVSSPKTIKRFYELPENKGEMFNSKTSAKRILIADIDIKGNVQGADVSFTQELLNEDTILWIDGYASWNTAGNTIGTVLPQGIVSGAFLHSFKSANTTDFSFDSSNPRNKLRLKSSELNTQFCIFRLLDDYLYHSIIRPDILKKINEAKWNSLRLDAKQTKSIEDYAFFQIKKMSDSLTDQIFESSNRKCKTSDLTFFLPWNRTFEAEIDFQLDCKNISPKK